MEKFSASRAGRLMACPASGNLEDAIPNWTEPVHRVGMAADQGTDVHAIFEKAWALSPADLRAFNKVTEYVAALRATRRFKSLIEAKVQATWLASQPMTTADLVLYTQDEIHVLDTKWGKIPVEVNDNEQLMFYAVTYGELAPKAKGVTVHILQPRCDNMESVFLDTNQLLVFRDAAIAAEKLVLARDMTFGPSDHCKFCPANPHTRGDKGHPLCPTMLGMLYPSRVDEDEILNL